jgi:hypothetical protein
MTTGIPQSLADEQRDEFVRAEFLRGLPDPASRHEKVGPMAIAKEDIKEGWYWVRSTHWDGLWIGRVIGEGDDLYYDDDEIGGYLAQLQGHIEFLQRIKPPEGV